MRAHCPFVCVIHLIYRHRQFYHDFTELWRTSLHSFMHPFSFQVLGLPCQTVVLMMQRLFLAKTKECFFVADHAIKIWRLFPFAEEALAPLMTLYCHETPRRLTVAHHKLCAAFHEPATASYNIVVFKTTQKSKCFIQIRIIIFLGTSITVKRLGHFSIYSAAI